MALRFIDILEKCHVAQWLQALNVPLLSIIALTKKEYKDDIEFYLLFEEVVIDTTELMIYLSS